MSYTPKKDLEKQELRYQLELSEKYIGRLEEKYTSDELKKLRSETGYNPRTG